MRLSRPQPLERQKLAACPVASATRLGFPRAPERGTPAGPTPASPLGQERSEEIPVSNPPELRVLRDVGPEIVRTEVHHGYVYRIDGKRSLA